jgi:hypothetical protein
MSDDYIECPQVSGKTIKALRIYRDTGDGTEVLIDLTDGTSFTFPYPSSPLSKPQSFGPASVNPRSCTVTIWSRCHRNVPLFFRQMANFRINGDS